MFVLTVLLIFAYWVATVRTRNDTLEHGWVPEPTGRGTWTILWTCLSTIFICTWAVLHLDVPIREHGQAYRSVRKIRHMFGITIAPELYLATAADEFFGAQALTKLLRERGYQGWTLTHTQFAFANGFHVGAPGGKASSVCSPERLRILIGHRRIDGPPISENELKSRGGSDSIIKFVAIMQIIWFVVQTLFRAVKNYHVTAVEIMTAGFVLCSTFTYWFYWHRPQNVEYPVVLQMKDVALANDENESMGSDVMLANAEDRAELSSAIENSIRVSERLDDVVPQTLIPNSQLAFLYFFAVGFGAIHCLAWNSPFPSSSERIAWRVCSVATTALPALLFPYVIYHEIYRKDERSFNTVSFIAVLLYVIARLTIIVLAFTSLRALPADAYETVAWTNYIPHFIA